MHVTQDPQSVAETAESVEAVRSVVREALDRASEDADATWAAFAAAGLLSLPVPEAQGGEGLGLPEVAVLLRETGQRAVQLPVWETLCCGVLTLAATGSEEQRASLLPGVASGEALLTPALREVGVSTGSATEAGRLSTTYAGGTVTGRKIGVTYADRAARLLVTATEGDGPVVALVDPSGPGVELLESGSSY